MNICGTTIIVSENMKKLLYQSMKHCHKPILEKGRMNEIKKELKELAKKNVEKNAFTIVKEYLQTLDKKTIKLITNRQELVQIVQNQQWKKKCKRESSRSLINTRQLKKTKSNESSDDFDESEGEENEEYRNAVLDEGSSMFSDISDDEQCSSKAKRKSSNKNHPTPKKRNIDNGKKNKNFLSKKVPLHQIGNTRPTNFKRSVYVKELNQPIDIVPLKVGTNDQPILNNNGNDIPNNYLSQQQTSSTPSYHTDNSINTSSTTISHSQTNNTITNNNNNNNNNNNFLHNTNFTTPAISNNHNNHSSNDNNNNNQTYFDITTNNSFLSSTPIDRNGINTFPIDSIESSDLRNGFCKQSFNFI
ncbi:hypothetical protein SNEBB_006555 [Seison nebaliae]|nr:hypothetical protein SNEBB_006555 [Seison nebaliae]